jgi:hypothetical protein
LEFGGRPVRNERLGKGGVVRKCIQMRRNVEILGNSSHSRMECSIGLDATARDYDEGFCLQVPDGDGPAVNIRTVGLWQRERRALAEGWTRCIDGQTLRQAGRNCNRVQRTHCGSNPSHSTCRLPIGSFPTWHSVMTCPPRRFWARSTRVPCAQSSH